MSYRILSFLVACFIALSLSGWKTWEQASAYEAETIKIIQQLEAKTQLENSGRQLLELLSFGTYQGYSRQLEQLEQQKALQKAYYDSVRILTGLFFSFALLMILFSWFLRKQWGDVGYALISISTVSLILGLITPILSIEASKELPVIGETVLQFQSKGIISSITSLIEHGNLWIAILLLIFSVVVPIAKTLTVFLTLFARSHHISIKGLHLSKNMGKWSMADVFVIAIIVVYFSSDQEVLTKAEIQSGLWFFASYVIMSLIGTQLVSKQIEKDGVTQSEA